MIVVVASIKGGTGKTTISTNLAVIRAQNASDVMLIDADPQMSAMDFVAVREEEKVEPAITASQILGKGITAELRKLKPKFDDIIVDVGGRDTSTLRGALLAADVLVVPFLPSQFDAWATEKMDETVGDAMQLNEKLRTVAFLNKADYNPKLELGQESIKLVDELINLKFSDIYIGNRVAFRRAVGEGLAVTELKVKRSQEAISEIKTLYNEVFKDEDTKYA